MTATFEKKLGFTDAYCEQVIAKVIANNCDNFASSLGCKNHFLHMKRENIAVNGFWRAKKNYAMNVWDSEGIRYHEAKLKVTGLESVKSSTPKLCADWLISGYSLILAEVPESKIVDFIIEKYDQYLNLPISDIALPIKADAEMFKPGADISGKSPHIRGGHLFNSLLTEHRSSEQPIVGGKIKYVLLTTHNKYKADAIAFNTELPPEFGLHKFINKKAMFEKSFLSPLATCCEVAGYKIPDNISSVKSAKSLSAFW